MKPDARVCPFCGDPPGSGVFCESCGRNLASVDQLPTRAAWEERTDFDPRDLAARCAAATAAFLAAMHDAGDPGTTTEVVEPRPGLRRARQTPAWVLRAVTRDANDDDVTRYTPGLVLTTAGRYHKLASYVRGWGQRDFPRFHDSPSPEPIDMPVERRLIGELAALLREHDVAADLPVSE